jgi:hypothetical protein
MVETTAEARAERQRAATAVVSISSAPAVAGAHRIDRVLSARRRRAGSAG